MFEHGKTSYGGSAGGRVLLGVATMAAALGLGASAARAELIASGTNTVPALFGFGGPFPVDINGPLMGTTLTIPDNLCPQGTPVMITYSAECSHNGTPAMWGTIQILLNGVVLSPTDAPPMNNDDAFCAGDGVAGVHDGRATHSMEVVGRCNDGVDVVAVTANSVAAGTTMRLDDMSTVVDR
jgi:hypothetical protein